MCEAAFGVSDGTDDIEAVRAEVVGLRRALESRTVIGVAVGIVMRSTGCTQEEAFETLRAQSQHENVKLRELAEEIVRRADHPLDRPPPEPAS